MTQDLINKIDSAMNPIPSINLRGIPANDSQIIDAQNELNVVFHDDYITFIKIFGGAYAGLPIYAFENNDMMTNQTIVDLTKSFREDYIDDKRSEILNESYVISFDGGGNPILVDSSERVLIFYHDNDEYKVFASSFSEFIEKAINKEYENEW